jgi:hypothetical protein
MMKQAHSAEPKLRRVRYGVAMVLMWGFVLGTGEADGEEKKKEKEKVVLEAAEEKALRGFVEKLKTAKQGLYEEGMKELVKSVREVVGVDEAAVAALNAAGSEAVVETMKGWDEKAYEWLSPYVGRSGNSIREMARWPVDQIAKSPGVEGVVPPDEQGVWKAFLKKSLTAEQWGKWEEKLKRDAAELKQRTEEHVAFSADNQRPNMEAEMELVVADITNTLRLPEERVAGLKKLAEEAIGKTVEVWKKGGMEALMKMDRERREMVIGNGNSGWRFGEEDLLPQEQEWWKAGLAALLTKEEAEQIRVAGEQRRERRLMAVQRAILQVLDEGVALTTEQRKVVLPMLVPMAEKLMSQMRRYYNMDPFTVAMVLRDPELKEAKAGLELKMAPEQRVGFERFMNPERYAGGEEEENGEVSREPPPATEEELEALLSAELIKRYEKVRETKMVEMKTHLQDLERQAGLREEQRLELSLAAVGAVQESLREVRQQLGSWLRQSVANTPNEAVRQRLASLGSAGFGNDPAALKSGLWGGALDRLLDEEQRRRWAAAEGDREKELREAQLLLVLSELDQQLALTSEQAAFYEGQLKRILVEYAEDLDEYNGARQWHLHAYSLLTPVMGVPEEEMKKQLSLGQMDLWMTKSESQVRHYWDGVKRKHEAREKAKAEAAKKAKEVKS